MDSSNLITLLSGMYKTVYEDICQENMDLFDKIIHKKDITDELNSDEISTPRTIYVGSPEAMVLNFSGQSLYEPLLKYSLLVDHHEHRPIFQRMFTLILHRSVSNTQSLPPLSRTEVTKCFSNACSRGHLRTAQWLYKNFKPIIRVNNALYKACKNGHLRVVQWVFNTIPWRQANSWSVSVSLFHNACIGGHLHIAQWLECRIPDIIRRSCSGWYFNLVCKNDHFPMIQWLFDRLDLEGISTRGEYGDYGYNKDISIDWIFAKTCSRGSLVIARWWVEKKPHLNYRIDDDYAFRHACANGHLHVAQWLWGMDPRPNIHAKGGFAMKEATRRRYYHVTQWLNGL